MSDKPVVVIDVPGRGVRKRLQVDTLTWFMGANGAGKTTAIMGVLLAAAGQTSKHINLFSEREGRISGFGVKVELGGKRPRFEGVPDVHVIDPGAFSRLVQPASDERPTRAAARIKALFQFKPTPVTVDTLLALAAGDEDVAALVQAPTEWKGAAEWQDLDLLDLSERVRVAANRFALSLEEQAAEAQGALRALQEQADGVVYSGSAEDSAVLLLQLETQRSVVERRRVEAEARKALEADKASIDLGARPDVNGAELDEALALDAVVALERQLSAAKEKHSTAQQQTRRQRAALQDWERRDEILKRPVVGATDAQVHEAEEELRSLGCRLEASKASEEWSRLQDQIAQVRSRFTEAGGRAKWYRGLVSTLPGALADVLRDQGLGGVNVVDGELATSSGRKIEDLSLGEVVRWAYGVACPAYEEAGVPLLLYLPEKPVSAWAALDTQGKLDFVEVCRCLGICLLVETATAGDLQVVHDVMEGLRAMGAAA